MIIRRATPEDELDFVLLFKQFHMEAPSQYSFSVGKVTTLFRNLIAVESGLILILESTKGVVGMLVGMITEAIFSEELIASELAWFVDKEHRGTKHSVGLVKTFEAWGKQNKADVFVISDLSGLRDLGKLYSRLGYNLTECSYIKENT